MWTLLCSLYFTFTLQVDLAAKKNADSKFVIYNN